MKRIIFSLIIACFILSANAHASDGDVLPSDRNHWTVTVAYDASIPGNCHIHVAVESSLIAVDTYRKFLLLGVEFQDWTGRNRAIFALVCRNALFSPGDRDCDDIMSRCCSNSAISSGK